MQDACHNNLHVRMVYYNYSGITTCVISQSGTITHITCIPLIARQALVSLIINGDKLILDLAWVEDSYLR